MPAAVVSKEVATKLSALFIKLDIAFECEKSHFVGTDCIISADSEKFSDSQMFHALDKLAKGAELDPFVYGPLTEQERAELRIKEDGVVLSAHVLDLDEGVLEDGTHTIYNVWKARACINGSVKFEKRGTVERAVDDNDVEVGHFDHGESRGQIY